MKVLVYGNCQAGAVKQTLNINPTIATVTYVPCYSTDITAESFTNLIKGSAVIITQPIKENYREQFYLSTQYIIETASKDCKIIIFDSCHFDFYYFDLSYKWFTPNSLLCKPIDYHYNEMINCFKNNKNIDYYLDNFVNNIDLKSSEELEELANKSLQELHNRNVKNTSLYNSDNTHIISTYQYIKENYKNKLLFYSMNHPSKYLIQYICEEIINILQIKNTINYNIDMLNNPKCILYNCISKVVNFNISDHNPVTCNLTDNYSITDLYFNTYKEIGYK